MKYFLSIMLSAVLMINSAFTVGAKTAKVEGNPEQGTKTAVTLQDVDSSKYKSPLSGNPKVVKDGERVKGSVLEPAQDEIVRVSIVLDKPSTLEMGFELQDIAKNKKAVSYRKSLVKEQVNLEKKIEKKLGKELNVVWNITLIGNMISAEVTYSDVEAIRQISGVKDVILENRYYASPVEQPDTAFTTEYMIFAKDAWEAGYTGAGSLIAIVDTGINHEHELFDPEAFAYSLQQGGKDVDLFTVSDIAAVLDQLNVKERMADATAEGLYKTTKIPFAFNYVNGSYNTDHASAHTDNHGSHVAGIAAGNYYVNRDGEFVESAEAVKAVGVAPDAQLMAMQVFKSSGGTTDSDYMVAIEDAIILGADAINLSLGLAIPGFTYNETYYDFLESLESTGAVVAMSAGNEGSFNHQSLDPEVVPNNYLYADDVSFAMSGVPGIYKNSLSTASADNLGLNATYVLFDDEAYATYTDSSESETASGPNQKSIQTLAGEEYEFLYIPSLGNPEDYAALAALESIEGKVVAVDRGSLSFIEKGTNALLYNPAAIFILNNASENIYMSLAGDENTDPYEGETPMILVDVAARDYFLENGEAITAGEFTYYKGKVYIAKAEETHDFLADYDTAKISSFSSWGPTGALTLKPEITAPGGAINSAEGNSNDGYVAYSGTSMAAPHTAGMAALLAEYVKANDLAKYTNGNQRTIIQSLLMSTAVPMVDEGYYYPVFQQGAGLADVAAAVNAHTFIMMSEDATASYADGKVKVELGDDPDRTGEYQYGFDVTNFSEETSVFELYTDMFTQWLSTADGEHILSAPDTDYLDAEIEYIYDLGYDVDKDGDTDEDDVQAILDYITGVLKEEDINTEVADVDGNGEIQALDAKELLWILDNMQGILFVEPGQTVHVDVKITLGENEMFNYYNEDGFYVEGFTYLFSYTDDSTHSIPILGFYGNWTDPSMFDKTVGDLFYKGEAPYGYSSLPFKNYPAVQYPGFADVSVLPGNPYALYLSVFEQLEDEYPFARLAISENTKLDSIQYGLLRAAATVAGEFYTKKAGSDDKNIIDQSVIEYEAYGTFLYLDETTNQYYWENTANYPYTINKVVKNTGVVEGDKIGARVVAIPEYYVMKLGYTTGVIETAEEAFALADDGTLGYGAQLAFEFTVDNTAPEILSVEANEDYTELTVKVKDNQYVAAVVLTDYAGSTVYDAKLPEQTEEGQELEVVFDISELDDQALVVYAGDYAANETYRLAVLTDGPVTVKMPYYRLTDTLEAGKEYVIANSKTAGTAQIMRAIDYGYYIVPKDVEVYNDAELGICIAYEDVSDENLWIPEVADADYDTFYINSKLGAGYMFFVPEDETSFYRAATYEKSEFFYDLVYQAYNEKILAAYVASTSQGIGCIYYLQNNFLCMDAGYGWPDYITRNYGIETKNCYIYTLDYYDMEIELDSVTAIEVNPTSLLLVLDVNDEADLFATVYPKYIEDKSVTWESEDEEVATVDQNGHVKATGLGETYITVTSNKTPEVYTSVQVKVVEAQPVDLTIYGSVTTEDGAIVAAINLNDMSLTPIAEIDGSVLGGGRSSGKYVVTLEDGQFIEYNAEDFSTIHDEFALMDAYYTIDGSNLPVSVFTIDGETNSFGECSVFSITPDGIPAALGYGYDDEGGLGIYGESYDYFSDENGTALLAVAFVGAETWENDTPSLYYVTLGINGDLGLLEVWYTNDPEGDYWYDTYYNEIGIVENLELTGKMEDYSLMYSDETGNLYLADSSTMSIYEIVTEYNEETDEQRVYANYVGKLSNVSRVAALFNDDYDGVPEILPAALREKLREARINAKPQAATQFSIKPEKEVVEVLPVAEEPAVEQPAVEEPVVEEPVAEEPVEQQEEPAVDETAMLRVISNIGYAKLAPKAVLTGELIDGNAEITYTEDQQVGSGVVTVTYDPENTKFVGCESELEFFSVNDDEEGTVTFAFAVREENEPEAGETLAVFSFENKNCEDTEVTLTVTERNEEEEIDDEETFTIEGLGHIWGEPEWTWEGDYSAATATFTCERDPAHTKEITVEAEAEITQPTKESDGEAIYTATVEFEGETYTDVVRIVLPRIPDTGDHSNNTVLIAVMIGCALAVGGIIFFLKKRENN